MQEDITYAYGIIKHECCLSFVTSCLTSALPLTSSPLAKGQGSSVVCARTWCRASTGHWAFLVGYVYMISMRRSFIRAQHKRNEHESASCESGSEWLISDDASVLKRSKEQKARWISSVSSKTEDNVTDNRQQENRKQEAQNNIITVPLHRVSGIGHEVLIGQNQNIRGGSGIMVRKGLFPL